MSSPPPLNCGSGGGDTAFKGLRIASLFIIWASSSFAATFPIVAHRSRVINLPLAVFETAKYFGSGVIIATGFIHLLAPGISELTSPCLGAAWQGYPYALALALLSSFSIFIVEVIAFRIGTAKLKKLGIHHDPHGHAVGAYTAHGPETDSPQDHTSHDHSHSDLEKVGKDDHEHSPSSDSKQELLLTDEDAMAQLIGVAILEFGVILHSVLIGLTLAVDANFKILFVVIIFHQMFEGLGVGTRLANLILPSKYNYVPYVGSFLYGITTPIGIAVGLGIRTTYNPGSTEGTLVSGILDSLSAGILLYTGFVELLAHEFLFSPEMREASLGKLLYALTCMMFGAGIMALLGKWA
uniref:Zinc transporter protein ZIP1 n=1 Tax=Russula atropurpurea TaxID=152952 RepID=A0A2H4D737_9AGAM|nr:zinc transporter protein ZIP1 [Russula atropurpurea]